MSLNLTVPKDSPTPPVAAAASSAAAVAAPSRKKERVKTRRTKSPLASHSAVRPRAKSKSPNPSFCSVLSRVKDWELGAFTPKTALADNVDVMNRSNVPFSDSANSQNKDTVSEEWKPSPTGSEKAAGHNKHAAKANVSAAAAAAAAASAAPNGAKPGGGDPGGGLDTNGDGQKAPSALLKSALSANLGKIT